MNDEKLTHRFHFTLGPVQGFVSQARRTRDFWAGSFILSWLSAVAMAAVEQQEGGIVFPKPDAEFMCAVKKGVKKGVVGPKQGSIPNRFMAKVGDGFDPRQVEGAVQAAWKALADKVWEKDLQGTANGKTKTVWEREIPAFWDIEWAMVREKGATDALDRLKNWRTHLPQDEPGVKCMMMDGWQELSGAERPGDKPKQFWKKVRESGKPRMATDLRPGEMLCAIAFIKRRFVHYFHELELEIDGWAIKGWKLPSGVPSVHYMAVAPWLAQLIGKAKENEDVNKALWNFHKTAYELTDNYGEWDSNIRCVRDAIGKSAEKKWVALDGAIFFDAMLENKNLWDERQQVLTKKVLDKLDKVRKVAKLDPPSPFYAVLLMDGDELGIQMSNLDKQRAIADGLARFTAGAGDIVGAHNGFLIYAGGDDVLALLPLEDALNCAASLRRHYLGCFATTPVTTSISAAIEYAHVKMPLGKVLRNAHDLLDNVAKDGRGRDAVACRVWKPGGMTVEWAQPWEIALKDCSVFIELLAEAFQKNQKMEVSEGEPNQFAGKFFYRIGERFDLLNPPKEGEDPVLSTNQATDLMAMEYLNSGASTVKTMNEAREIVQPLLVQCRPVERDKTKPKEQWKVSDPLNAHGALLVRFLAQKGVER